MYKVLIVDDELIERKGLTKILKKEFQDELIIRSAENGKKAIEMTQTFNPNIVFMDIKMPGMTGIEAMKKIKKFNSEINVVIISAFDSFKYAQEALNNNAYEYLLKPVKRDDIITCLKRLIKEEEQKLEERDYKREILSIKDQSLQFINENIIDYIMISDLEKLNVIIDHKFNTMPLDSGVSVVIENKKNDEILKTIRKFCQSNYDSFLFRELPNTIIIFINDTLEKTEKVFRELFLTIKDDFSKELNMAITSYNQLNEIFDAYKKNLNKIYSIDVDDHGYMYPINLENELINKINLSLLNESVEMLDKIYIWLDGNISSKENMLRYLVELEVFINRTFFKKTEDNKILKPIEPVSGDLADQVKFFKIELKNKLIKTIKNIIMNSNSNLEELINEAKVYISNNYMDDITLESVANEMCISSYYFSKLFKKEANINFIDYLTDIRMKNAKYKIRNTNKSIKQISKEVGYNDPNYFSRVFKKQTGYSPSKYKKI
jgi:two-component system response regulator YesN